MPERLRVRCRGAIAAAIALALPTLAAGPPAGAAAARVFLPWVGARADLDPPGRAWGVQLALEHYPAYHDGTVAADLARARSAGLGMVRTFVRWDEIEPSNVGSGDYDWRATDARLAPYRDAGAELIVSIVAYPPWATVYRCGYDLRAGMAAEWRAFVRALALRYGGPAWRVVLWEIGNEVDGRTTVRPSDFDPVRRPPGFAPGEPTVPIGGCWGDRASEFVAFHRAAWRELRLVDPSARVAFGGLAYSPFEDNFVPGFLDAFLAAGGGPLIDVLSVHWFGGVGYHEATGPERIRALRASMERHGVDVPIWLTEIHRMTRHRDADSELWPVAWLTRDLVEVLAEPAVDRVVWYGWRDFPDEVVAGVGVPWQRGMVRADGSDKPALAVLEDVVRVTGGHPSPMPVRAGRRADAEAAALDQPTGRLPSLVVDGAPEAVFAATFVRGREVHAVAFSRDGSALRAWIALPSGMAVTVHRYPVEGVRSGTAPVVERPAVRRGVVEVALGADAAIVRLAPPDALPGP